MKLINKSAMKPFFWMAVCALPLASWAGSIEDDFLRAQQEVQTQQQGGVPSSDKAQTQGAQAPAIPEDAVAKMDVRELVLKVSVSDDQDNYYPNLEKENFVIKLNKKEQPINFFTRRELPISFAFVFDVTGSMAQVWPTKEGGKVSNFGLAKLIITSMLKGNLDKDEFILALVKDQEPRVVIPTFTQDVSEVEKIISEQNPKGLTPLYDTMLETMQAIDKAHAHNDKKAMIIVTDGEENNSKQGSFKMMERLQPELKTQVFMVIVPGAKRKYRLVCKGPHGEALLTNDDTIDDAEGKGSIEMQAQQRCSKAVAMDGGHSAGQLPGSSRDGNRTGLPDTISDEPASAAGPRAGGGHCMGTPTLQATSQYDLCYLGPQGLDDAKKYAESTGGRVFDAKSPRDMEQAFKSIYAHLRMQYFIGFEPTGKLKDWNKVEISFKNLKPLFPNGAPELKAHKVSQIPKL